MSLIYFHHYYARKGSHFREIIRRNTDLPKVLSSFLKKTILIASGWPKNPDPSTGEEVPYFWKFTFFKNSISLVENLRLKISTANLKTKPKKVKSHRGTHRNHFFLQKKIRPIRIFFFVFPYQHLFRSWYDYTEHISSEKLCSEKELCFDKTVLQNIQQEIQAQNG